jgi:hypothetical protein
MLISTKGYHSLPASSPQHELELIALTESENRRPGGNDRPGFTNFQNASQSSVHSNSPQNQGALVRHDQNDSAGTQRSGQSSQSYISGDAGVALALQRTVRSALSL